MGEKLLQNPPPHLLYLLPTYLDENEKLHMHLSEFR